MLQPKPMILTFNSNPNVYISKLVPTDDRISTRDEINNWQSKYPLPAFEDKCFSYSPFGIVITSKNPISNSNGWKVTHSTYWSDTMKKYKREIISSRINNVIRRRDSAQKIGRDWSFFKQHVEEENGEKSTIHYCLSAWFVEVNGIEGIACDFVRKVRSASSIQDELNMGFLPNGEGYSDVMVTVDSGKNTFSSGRLVKILDETNLNTKIEGSLDTIREYDERKGYEYSDEEGNNTCVAIVKQGRREYNYAASRIYRVLRIEDWGEELKVSMSEILRLAPSEYSGYVMKGIRLLRGITIGGNMIDISRPHEVNWDIGVAKSSEITKAIIDGEKRKFSFNGRWHHHIQKRDSEPLPKVSISFCMFRSQPDILDTLKRYTKKVFAINPGWEYDFLDEHYEIVGENQTQIRQSINEISRSLEKLEGNVLMVSALPPPRPDKDTYTWLKRDLSEKGIKHQNYKLVSHNRLSAPDNESTHIINACQLHLKFGFLPVPFEIELGDIDLTIGVDIGRKGRNQSRPAMAVSIDKYGRMYGGVVSTEPQAGEEMSEDTLRSLIFNQVSFFKEKIGENPKRILILRDGISSNKELRDVNKIRKEWLGLDVDIAWLTVQKTGVPRLLNFSDGRVHESLPNPESYMKTGNNSGWCWTTGGQVGRFPGIPRGFSFRVEFNYELNPISIDNWSRILIAQAKSSQVSPYSNTRLPFTLHLADKMAKAIIRNSIPPNYSGEGFPAC